ncbi:MAG: hypothetical protein A2044_07700 [Candidatus Firestonebacteria bacterium GWA2_43_8]|nr:MAG: hypothetical protein A2044_07700 [Candidatus Firestonebacteria bacterium GWA2_43_8]
MKSNNVLGVQSWCFRNFKDNNVMLPMLKETGISSTELCVVHADFKNVSMHKPVLELYKKLGVNIVSTGVNVISAVEAEARPNFEFLKAGGVKHMSVDFKLDNLDVQLKVAEKLSEEYNVTLGIHNHGGRHWLGNMQALKWVFGKCSKRIGLSLDTAWAMHSQENVTKMIEEFKDRLYLLHLKDFTFDRTAKPEDVIFGTGAIDLKALKKVLEDTGFKGSYIIEYEGQPENPVPVLIQCVKNIKEALY